MSGGKVDIKVVLLGDMFVGKTSLMVRYTDNRYIGHTVQATIGAAFRAKTVVVNNKSVVIGIWDTSGCERYDAMSRLYFRGAKAAIVCYDLTNTSSFDRARFWIGELQKHEEGCQIHMCGTKYDLIEGNPELRRIDEEEIKALAIDVRADVYETSSKTGKDIDKIFVKIATDYLNSKPDTLEEDTSDIIKLNPSKKHLFPCCRI